MDKLIKWLDQKRLWQVAILQALFLFVYCSLIGILMWKGNDIFGKVSNYWGPLTFLILFCTSVLISAFLILGYPFILFWVQKKPKKAINLVFQTTLWLVGLLLLLLLTLLII